jgi:uncharacterized membrane protein YkvA (DUF1232 family)
MPWFEKLRQRARELNREVAALLLAARHPRTTWYAKLLMLLIVAYAVSPIDLIPDFIPVVGLLDDLLLLPLGIALVLRFIPKGVMAECRAQAQMNEAERDRLGRFGAIGVALVWLILLILAAGWAVRAFSQPRTDAGPPAAASTSLLLRTMPPHAGELTHVNAGH